MKINVATQFSKFPAGRFPQDGDFNGQRFRQAFLEPHFRSGIKGTLEIDFTGVYGWGSSFLEEAFGGLVRTLGIPGAQVWEQIKIVSADESLEPEVQEYVLKVRS